MDAVEFLKSYKRMCESNSRFLQIDLFRTDFEGMVGDTEKWAKDHPVKTKQSEFLKIYPNAMIDDKNVISINPCKVEMTVKRVACSGNCARCRRNYWLQEVE